VFDHEMATRVELVVVASDRGEPVARTSSVVVSVSVVDINDEAPTFTRSNYSFGTYENQRPGICSCMLSLPMRLCLSAWLGFSSPSVRLSVCQFVCLSVFPQHNSETNDPKVFKLCVANDLGIS